MHVRSGISFIIFALALAFADAASAQVIEWRRPGSDWERIRGSNWYRPPEPRTGVEAGREVGRENDDRRSATSDEPPALPVGAEVLARNGARLGVIVGVMRAEPPGEWFGVVRDERGDLRAIEVDAIRSLQDGRVATELTQYEFRRLRSVRREG